MKRPRRNGNSTLEGQREAAIREYMAGLTVVRTTFRNVPVGIEIARAYSDQLWVKDSRFENVSGAMWLEYWLSTMQIGHSRLQ